MGTDRSRSWPILFLSVALIVTACVLAIDGPADASGLPPAPAGVAFYEPPSPLPAGSPGTIIWGREEPGPTGATTWLILYKSKDIAGSDIAVTGRVIVPDGASAGDGRPVVAWAHGAVGNGDECAPSRTIPATAIPSVDAFVAAGYVVTATDYQGLGTPGPHAFLIEESEARSVLDSIRAARNVTDAAGERAVVYGASRGGHAAIAASDHAAYAPDVDLIGVVGSGAGIGNAETVIDSVLATGNWPFIAMALWSFETFYGPDYPLTDSLLTDLGLANLDVSGTGCAEAVFTHFMSLGGVEATFEIPRPSPSAAVRAALADLDVGTRPGAPLLLVHGIHDDVVPVDEVVPWVERACAQGMRVTLSWYLEGHVPLAGSTPEVEAWIADRFAGVPAGSDCSAVPPPPPQPGIGTWYGMVGLDGTAHVFPTERHVGNAQLVTFEVAVDFVRNHRGTGYYVLSNLGRVHAIGPHSVNRGDADLSILIPGERPTALALSSSGLGYWIFTNRGRALPFGDAPDIGDVSNLALAGEIVDAAPFPPGFYVTGTDGGIFTPPHAGNDVPFLGSVPGQLAGVPLNEPIVTVYVDEPDGRGYSLAAGDGGMFNFESEFCGSIPGILPGVTLNQPIVNAVPFGDCYVFFAADGGAFVFGDEPFLGSIPGRGLTVDDITSGDAFTST